MGSAITKLNTMPDNKKSLKLYNPFDNTYSDYVNKSARQNVNICSNNVIGSYTEDCVNKRIVTTVAHSQPMAGKKDWLD